MWQLNKGSYYKFDSEELVESIIHNGNNEAYNPNTYNLQIKSSDGGIISIGTVKESEFDSTYAQIVCDYAIDENKDYDWWLKNRYDWWKDNTIYD